MLNSSRVELGCHPFLWDFRQRVFIFQKYTKDLRSDSNTCDDEG